MYFFGFIARRRRSISFAISMEFLRQQAMFSEERFQLCSSPEKLFLLSFID